jgi:hypothetical protein
MYNTDINTHGYILIIHFFYAIFGRFEWKVLQRFSFYGPICTIKLIISRLKFVVSNKLCVIFFMKILESELIMKHDILKKDIENMHQQFSYSELIFKATCLQMSQNNSG